VLVVTIITSRNVANKEHTSAFASCQVEVFALLHQLDTSLALPQILSHAADKPCKDFPAALFALVTLTHLTVYHGADTGLTAQVVPF
jgi:hypothetical protein